MRVYVCVCVCVAFRFCFETSKTSHPFLSPEFLWPWVVKRRISGQNGEDSARCLVALNQNNCPTGNNDKRNLLHGVCSVASSQNARSQKMCTGNVLFSWGASTDKTQQNIA